MNKRSKIYVDSILEPIYRFTKREYFVYILQINIAHISMLAKQQILQHEEATKMVEVNRSLQREGFDKEYDPQFEDLFFMLEDQMTQMVGEELVGNMHIAFSRNDMDATMFRMHFRKKLAEWLEEITQLQTRLLQMSTEHKDTIMTAYTHNQQAQPTTLAHYLLGLANHLQRDLDRGYALLERMNECPMGAAALGTTGFPIDREYMAEMLGFDKAMDNSYDAIAAADYMLEIGSTLSIYLSTLSRFVYDFIFLATNEVSGIRLDDSLVQTSSIMPQKRNPSSLEHTRSAISHTLGRLQGTYYMTHSVPFGDIVDIGDDIQPVLQEGIDETVSITKLLSEILSNTSFNKQELLKKCENGFSTVTELADTLVRQHGFSFRMAHKIVQSYVGDLINKGSDLKEGNFQEFKKVVSDTSGVEITMSEADYLQAIDPRNFIQVRAIKGGPNPNETERQVASLQVRLERMTEKVRKFHTKLQTYENRLDVAELIKSETN